MSTTREHLARAKQNLQFAQSFELETTPYIDWVVTAYFYAALHLVDAILWERDRINPADHHDRNNLVRNKDYLKAIKTSYRTLKDRSEDARYDLITFASARIRNDVIPLYQEIERHILSQLP